ncbi:MAG: hypothetical protein OCC49_05160 [Fibrobacterales bacterium]
MNMLKAFATTAIVLFLSSCYEAPLFTEPGGGPYQLTSIDKRIAAPDGTIPEDSTYNSNQEKIPVITPPFMADHYFIPEGWLNPRYANNTLSKDNPEFEMHLSKGTCQNSEPIHTDKSSTYTPDSKLCNTINYHSISDTLYVGMYWLNDANWGTDAQGAERPVNFKIKNTAKKVTFWLRGTTNIDTLKACTENPQFIEVGECDWLRHLNLVVGNETNETTYSGFTSYPLQSAWFNSQQVALDTKWHKYEMALREQTGYHCSEFDLDCDRQLTGYATDSTSQTQYNAFGWLTATSVTQIVVPGYRLEFNLDSLMYTDEEMIGDNATFNDITPEDI